MEAAEVSMGRNGEGRRVKTERMRGGKGQGKRKPRPTIVPGHNLHSQMDTPVSHFITMLRRPPWPSQVTPPLFSRAKARFTSGHRRTCNRRTPSLSVTYSLFYYCALTPSACAVNDKDRESHQRPGGARVLDDYELTHFVYYWSLHEGTGSWKGKLGCCCGFSRVTGKFIILY
ncbi:cell surface antigen, partial [Sesbania bispinosa]